MPPLNTEKDLEILSALSQPKEPGVGEKFRRFGMGFGDVVNRAYGGQGGFLDRSLSQDAQKRREAVSNFLAQRKMKESDRAFGFQQEQADRAQTEREEDRNFRRELLKSNQDFQKEQAALNRANQAKIAQMSKDITKSEKLNKLFVPSMNQYALSEQDAKVTKDALTQFGEFERMVQDMIALREKHGAEAGIPWISDKDAIAMGKQLSKQALLKLKDIAKLGVLSKSDERIIEQIIPDDPLEVHMVGNPTMAKLNNLLNQMTTNREAFLLERGFDPSVTSTPGAPDQNAGGGVTPSTKTPEERRARLEYLRNKKKRANVKFVPDKPENPAPHEPGFDLAAL